MTIKNLIDSQVTLNHTSDHDRTFVQFDAMVSGINGKNASHAADLLLYGVSEIVKNLPFDVCVYSGMQFQNATTIYQVPVQYLAKPSGEMIVTPTQMHIKGVYINTSYDLAKFDRYVQNMTQAPTDRRLRLVIPRAYQATVSGVPGEPDQIHPDRPRLLSRVRSEPCSEHTTLPEHRRTGERVNR